MATLVIGALIGALALVLPGALAARALDDGDLLTRVAVGLGVGVLVVPFAGFLLAWALRVSMSPWLLLATSAVISGPLVWWERRRAA